jgi:hypothetical protein
MSTTYDLKCVELSEVRDMTGSGEYLVIRCVTGEELMGGRPWCQRKSDVAWLSHSLDAIRRWVIAGPFDSQSVLGARGDYVP